jgi:hypothetical protein
VLPIRCPASRGRSGAGTHTASRTRRICDGRSAAARAALARPLPCGALRRAAAAPPSRPLLIHASINRANEASTGHQRMSKVLSVRSQAQTGYSAP